ncbi:MAG: cold shock CspA family protein [Cellvibrionaceae bacterium]|jgi:cold shock CspA family protein
MNFSDHWATDSDGNKFLFRVEMQRQLSEQGLPVTSESLNALAPSAQQSRPHRNQEERPQRDSNFQQKREPEQSRRVENRESDEDFEEPATIQIDPGTGKYIGRVKWYNVTKGYGFISRGGNEDIFFHKSDVESEPDSLDRGVWVLYDVEETPKGFEASEVETYDKD